MNETKNMSFKQIMETAGNLFQNAIRFATNETKLVITHNKNENVVEITASDAGPPPIDVSTLFQSSYYFRDEAAILPQEKPETQSEVHEQTDS
jgi:signal transduction histidine kinase